MTSLSEESIFTVLSWRKDTFLPAQGNSLTGMDNEREPGYPFTDKFAMNSLDHVQLQLSLNFNVLNVLNMQVFDVLNVLNYNFSSTIFRRLWHYYPGFGEGVQHSGCTHTLL